MPQPETPYPPSHYPPPRPFSPERAKREQTERSDAVGQRIMSIEEAIQRANGHLQRIVQARKTLESVADSLWGGGPKEPDTIQTADQVDLSPGKMGGLRDQMRSLDYELERLEGQIARFSAL